MRISKAAAIAHMPSNLEDLAFLSVRELSAYVRTKKVSSTALTEMYLARLKRYTHAPLRRHAHRGARDDPGARSRP